MYTYRTGTTTKVNKDEVITPPMTAWPMGALCSAPSLKAKANGTMPNTMAKVVMRMGRSRTLAAMSRASSRPKAGMSGVPWRARMAKSTNRMAFLVTKPMSKITPMTENMLSDEPNINRASTTPMSVSGSELMRASGCKKLWNWLAKIM